MARAARGRTHTNETRQKVSESKQSPERKEQYQFYLTLPKDLDVAEKVIGRTKN